MRITAQISWLSLSSFTCSVNNLPISAVSALNLLGLLRAMRATRPWIAVLMRVDMGWVQNQDFSNEK